MKYCANCLYPEIAVNINIDDSGICTSCKTAKKFNLFNKNFWHKRKKKLEDIIRHRKKNNSTYDCIIPVSGGKDSYYQTHVITKIFKLKPLLVTYDGNNWLPEGEYNRNQMKYHFNADHIMWSVNVDVLKKLNRLAFLKIGDMNWQNHCGIFTAPIIIAEKFNIELIIWGETEWDIAGMYDPEDFVEFSARSRHEHSLRGYEWNDFINNNKKNRLTEKDLLWAKYPSDEEILKKNIKGIYIGNFFKWDGKKNAEMAIKNYSWKISEKPFERTYRRFSNLDDRYENGVHDLMKFIKFGYGRCTDHASKDIRNNHMSRNEGIKIIKKKDHIISKDLFHWLEYVEMSIKKFWEIADTFRDPRVWWIKNHQWHKDNIWGYSSAYGEVNLNKKQINIFKEKREKLLKSQTS